MIAVAEKALELNIAEVERRREKLGMTMQQASEAAGFNSRQQWSNIVNGNRKNVPIATLGRLAKALSCQPSDLLK